MNDITVGRVIRAIRVRKGWRQVDVSVRCGVSQQLISDIELGRLEDVCLKTLRDVCRSLDIELSFAPRWRGPELDRLLDADHAALVDLLIRMLRAAAWETLPEWTFNHYGERGSIDILAWHEPTRTLLIIEVKTRIVDVQALLASHGRKVRIAPLVLSKERGWTPLAVGRLLVLPEGSTPRHEVSRHAATFEATYPARNRTVRDWLGAPVGSLGGLLFLRVTAPGGIRRGATRVRTADRSGASLRTASGDTPA